jgi:hypothetical protein
VHLLGFYPELGRVARVQNERVRRSYARGAAKAGARIAAPRRVLLSLRTFGDSRPGAKLSEKGKGSPMIRHATFAIGLGLILVACGSTQATPGGAASMQPQKNQQCLRVNSACATSADCCSVWCVLGTCEEHPTP